MTNPVDDLAAEWPLLTDDERSTESTYVASLVTSMDVFPYVSGGRTRFELTDDQLVALIRRVRKDATSKALP